jgi:hypothetical protein
MDALILLGLLILASSVLGVVAFVLVLLVRAETRFHGTRILELSRKLNRLIQQSEPAAPETPAAAPEEEPAPAAIRALQQWGRFEEMVGKRGIAWAGALVLFLAAASCSPAQTR